MHFGSDMEHPQNLYTAWGPNHRGAALQPPRRHAAPDPGLRRRPRLQRPDPVPGELALRAPNLGARAKGKGVDIAVFELSAYQHSDIAHWAHQFYGPNYNPPL